MSKEELEPIYSVSSDALFEAKLIFHDYLARLLRDGEISPEHAARVKFWADRLKRLTGEGE